MNTEERVQPGYSPKQDIGTLTENFSFWSGQFHSIKMLSRFTLTATLLAVSRNSFLGVDAPVYR
jgi:hypothetical protein